MFLDPRNQNISAKQGRNLSGSLKEKDSFSSLPLSVTLRKTRSVLLSNGKTLLGFSLLFSLLHALVNLAFLSTQNLASATVEGFWLYLIQLELFSAIKLVFGDFFVIGYFTLAIYRFMLVGETPWAIKGNPGLALFFRANLRVCLLASLTFLPYCVFVIFEISWAAGGDFAQNFLPLWMTLTSHFSYFLKFLSAIGFYLILSRLIFVLPATAVGNDYLVSDSWRVTSGVWIKMIFLQVTTLGSALGVIASLQALWYFFEAKSIWLGIISSIIWVFGFAAFTVAISIAFCLRTGWRPGTEKVAVKSRS